MRRARPKPEKLRASPALRDLVNNKLKEHWSPQQITRHLARHNPGQPDMHACPETIYRALYNGLLDKRTARLRTRRTRRKKQRRGIPTKNAIPNMRPVHTRPREAEDRGRAGHWEGDLIVGKGQRSAIGTLVDRATRYTRLIHLPAGWKAPQVRDALVAQTAGWPVSLRRTLTWNQGRELYHHEEIEELTGFRIYFCDPHSPWQRGTNENTNGLTRRTPPSRPRRPDTGRGHETLVKRAGLPLIRDDQWKPRRLPGRLHRLHQREDPRGPRGPGRQQAGIHGLGGYGRGAP
ncbi:IS30 family transposase [Streptomyces sp. NPDC026665]|uniref:IS30 family transposase n=1 Tax=Streptomyces sp. NPDC026665 TaxID=3154798 RepID=UPI0033F1177C